MNYAVIISGTIIVVVIIVNITITIMLNMLGTICMPGVALATLLLFDVFFFDRVVVTNIVFACEYAQCRYQSIGIFAAILRIVNACVLPKM